MTGLRFLLVATLVAFVAPAVRAQKVGEQAPEFGNYDKENQKDRLYLAKYRGKIVVLEFWRTDDATCLDSLSLLSSLNKKYGKKGVVVLGVTGESKEKVEKVIESKKVEFHYGYGGAVHEIYDVTSFPMVFLIDPRGTIVWRGNPADELEEHVADLLEHTPPVGANKSVLERRLSAAQKAHEAGDLGRAAALAREVSGADDSALEKKGEELLSKIEDSGRKRLSDAQAAVNDKKLDDACRMMAEVIVAFEGSDLGSTASEESEKLKTEQEKTRDIFPKALNQARGALRNQQARDMEEDRDYDDAMSAYREVIDKYAGTEAAKAAAASLDKLNTDPAVQKAMNDARGNVEAARWLDIADRYVRVEMKDEARAMYEKIIQTHASSPSAERARKRLEKLKKG